MSKGPSITLCSLRHSAQISNPTLITRMVYRRRSKGRSRRRGFKRRAITKARNRAFTKRVKRIAQRTHELKYVTTTLGNWNAVGSAATTIALKTQMGLTQSTGAQSSIIGREVTIHSIWLRGTLVGGNTGLITDDWFNSFRIVLASFVPGTLTTWSAGMTVNSYLGKVNGLGVDTLKYKIWDKKYMLHTAGGDPDGAGYIPMPKFVSLYKRFKNGLKIKFRDDALTLPDQELMLSMVSDSTAVPNPGFVDGFLRVTYTDA